MPTDPTSKLFRLICSFVDKSGGIEKINAARAALREVAESGQVAQYVTGIGKTEAGAKQLLAAALLGFSMASALYEAKRKEN